MKALSGMTEEDNHVELAGLLRNIKGVRRVRRRNRKGHRYITVEANGGHYSPTHCDVDDLIRALYPTSVVTSGSYGRASFDSTWRLNP